MVTCIFRIIEGFKKGRYIVSLTKLGGIKMSNIKCISVSAEFEKLAKQYGLSWSNAARVGMSILLADLNLVDYDNDINVIRRLRLLAKDSDNKLKQIAELQKELAEIESKKQKIQS